MTFRRPTLQLQFKPRTATSNANCTAAVAAMAADADSRGAYAFTHADVRRASDEPVPSVASPGLNLHQVDRAVFSLTGGNVDLDTHPIGSTWDAVPPAMRAGRWALLTVERGVLVDAGLGGSSPFRRGHAILAGHDPDEGYVIADPLIPYWQRAPIAVLERGAREFMRTVGKTGAYYALTRDVWDEPVVARRYSALFNRGSFFVYNVVDGRIDPRDPRDVLKFRQDTSAPVDPPVLIPWPGKGRRKLARVRKGLLAGRYIEPGSTNVTLKVA